MRRLLAAAMLAPSLAVVQLAPAAAQEEEEEEPAVRLVLEDQTTTASANRPFTMQVRIVNDGAETWSDLSLTFWLYPAARSRSEYEQALDVDLPTPLKVETLPLGQRRLQPGEEVSVRLEPRIGVLEDLDENALYPLRVQLSSGLEPIAVLRSAVVYLVKPPLIGLNVALVFVLDAPLVLGPRGVFADDTLEEALARGGHLRRVVDVLRDVPVRTTLVVSPLLLQQLQAMVAGYEVVEVGGGTRAVPPDAPGARRAQRALDGIAEIARRPETQLVALPYASPSLPALVSAGMNDDLESQLARGRAVVEARLGEEPAETSLWPPASAVTEPALDALAAEGIENLLVDADTLPPPAGSKFTRSAIARLETDGGSSFRVLTPDPLIDARLSQGEVDARIRAQWVLGELASIYFEHPGRDRGVALVFAENDEPPDALLRRLLSVLRSATRAPWMRAVTASRLLEPSLEPPPDRRTLDEPEHVGRFPAAFVEAVGEARDAIAQLASIGGASETIDRLRELVLLSQSRYLLGDDERRIGYLDRVQEVVSEEFAKIQTPEPGVVTLTSLHGEVPVTIRNLAEREVEVQITLQSSRLEFLEGSTHTVTLSPPAQRFEFPVRAETTGRFGVHVEVRTPLGAEIAETDIGVRSTAYNRVALVVTIGAALFLLGLWARRFLPRRS
ncbi:MAG TPA: DUF6049 family protein [Actinomycetota bacterium]|nr:DUF6049 family protein [Actinomycetota bacterium]